MSLTPQAETHWLTPQQLDTWRAMLRAQSLLFAALDRELLSEHKLGLNDFDVFVQLSEAPRRALRMTELAKAVLISPSGLTRRLDGLVKQGFVERRQCPEDGRGLLAVLTPKGFEKLQMMAPTHLRGVRQYFVEQVDPDVMDILGVVYRTMAEVHTKAEAN